MKSDHEQLMSMQGIYETLDDVDPKVHSKHAVVIVGMNEEEGYFIIRNSWGLNGVKMVTGESNSTP